MCNRGDDCHFHNWQATFLSHALHVGVLKRFLYADFYDVAMYCEHNVSLWLIFAIIGVAYLAHLLGDVRG